MSFFQFCFQQFLLCKHISNLEFRILIIIIYYLFTLFCEFDEFKLNIVTKCHVFIHDKIISYKKKNIWIQL